MNPLTLSPEAIKIHMEKLTPREGEVVYHIASGVTDRAISTLLSISCHTVKRHVLNARQKIGAENRLQLVEIFVMWRQIDYNKITCALTSHSANDPQTNKRKNVRGIRKIVGC